MRKVLLFIVFLAFLAGGACRVQINLDAPDLLIRLVSTPTQPVSSPTFSSSGEIEPSPATPTALPPTSTSSPTATNTPTELPTATFTPTPTLRPTASALQLQVFDELWQVINEDYLYPDFNGLDWQVVRAEYQQRIQEGLSPDEFYQAMFEMVTLLGDEHSIFFSPEQVAAEESEFAGEYQFVGIGIMTKIVPEHQRVTILLIFPGSPAEQAGLQLHDSILAVDGQPIIDEDGDQRDRLLRGPEGAPVTLTVQTPGEDPRQVTLVRRKIQATTPVPYQVLTSPEGKRIGYLVLSTFNDNGIPRKVRQAMLEMQEDGNLQGLIIDNRHNTGGASNIFEAVLSFFENGRMGWYINRQGQESLAVRGRDIANSQRLPLVVLVGPGTASYGEIFSGILRDTQRAHLIGEQTEGNVEILSVYEFADGSRAWIAHDRFVPINHPQADWEVEGITPHEIVFSNWDEVTLFTDPVVNAALDHFDR